MLTAKFEKVEEELIKNLKTPSPRISVFKENSDPPPIDPNAAKLTLKVVSATLIRDTELFGKMDPFVVIIYNGYSYKTKVMKNAGKAPIWNEYFELSVYSMGEQLKVTIYDDDGRTKDLVGSDDIPTYVLCRQRGISEWFNLYYKGKIAGQIYLESKYEPPKENK